MAPGNRNRKRRQLKRISTGNDRLDGILQGGIPEYSVIFIAGLPGTGKTILSQQALFANARANRTGLYLSTISEPVIKVLRFLQGFTFFRQTDFGKQVIYGDLGSVLRREGPDGLLRQLEGLVREHRPSLLVIDSFKVLRESFADPLTFRAFTSDLAVRLSTWEVTTLLVGEYSDADIQSGPEFAIADGIVYLYGTEEAEKQKRFLRVMKMRGTAFFAGEHFFDLSDQGIDVFPRMSPEVVGEYAVPGTRTGSVIAGLNAMLNGGVYESTTTLISGGTGSGKTLMALSFLAAGAMSDQPGLMVSFEESSKQMTRNAQAFGWDLEGWQHRGILDLFHVSPSELDVDRHAYVIKERADRMGAKLVAIDSISAFEATVPNLSKYQSYLWAISDYFKRKGITAFLTTEIPVPFEALAISTRNVSFVADNIIFLRYVELGGEVKRVVGVLKMRGSRHDVALREYIIEAPRIAVGARLEQTGLLSIVRG
ncbi:MAG: circadian clock protein KaiC [Chloroflexi bacterium]|nr:circadian clock protein KaiC [Chloroflexota bacterium]